METNSTCSTEIKCGCKAQCLNVCAFSLACGIAWGLGTLILGLFAFFSGFGMMAVSNLGSVYMGFAPTVVGSIIGAFWGFVDGAIGGAVIAFVYNRCARKRCCCCNKDKCQPPSA